MSISACDQLDDYLVGALSADQRASFDAHLAGCPACRQQCAQQKQIDRLLVQGARQLDPVPASLFETIEQQVRRSSRRRTLRLAWGLSAAVLLMLAAGIGLATRQFSAHPVAPSIVQQPAEPTTDGNPVDGSARQLPNADRFVQVTVPNPAEAIVLPVETDAANVSIVWIYPTVQPVRAATAPATD